MYYKKTNRILILVILAMLFQIIAPVAESIKERMDRWTNRETSNTVTIV
ncbi:MAG: hypothetical protein GX300_10610 [Tissierellia bacterium]|nr:hypothetical protein [Tissierellia bacterium]